MTFVVFHSRMANSILFLVFRSTLREPFQPLYLPFNGVRFVAMEAGDDARREGRRPTLDLTTLSLSALHALRHGKSSF
jgi:hypothetical protein